MKNQLTDTVIKALLDSEVQKQDIYNDDYIKNEILDSMQVVELITALENSFDIEIDPDDIIPENFVNIDAVEKMVKRYLESNYPGGMKQEEGKTSLESLWDMTARHASDEDAISQAGWINSFTGKPFSIKEMDEYVDNIYTKVKPYITKDSKVLEFGVGSGLVVKRIAPEVEKYSGIDISEEILKKAENNIKRWGISNTSLYHGDIRKISEIDLKEYDLIMANSVVNYLDNVNEYNMFINECLKHVSSGAVFIGDVLNADKRCNYQKELLNNGRKEHNKLLWYTADELINAVTGKQDVKAEVTDKTAWTIPNEMNQYRFDVLYSKGLK